MAASFGGTYLRLAVREDGIVHIVRDRTGLFREPVYPAVDPGPERELRAEAEFLLPGLRVRVDPETGAVSFATEEGKLLLRELPPELAPAEIRLNDFQPGAAVRETVGADGARSFAVPARSRTDRTGVRGALRFQVPEADGLYGLGSHEEGFGNLRGHERLLYQHNLKAVVPVLVSTAGWAVLFGMGCAMRFRDDGRETRLFFDCADRAEWYFLYGDGSYASLMGKMRSLTGPAPMLPRYALGYTQSKERYATAEELARVAAEYRRRGIPLDLIVQDWQTWPEGQWGLKRFDRARYPEGFVKPLHDMHVRVMLSVWPNLQGDRNGDREELLRAGCMLGNRSTYNAFLPEAREIYFRQIRDGLMGEGIDAWWCDCTEPFESDWHGAERLPDDERMRLNTEEARTYLDPAAVSLFSLFHSRGIYEGLRREGNARALNLTRSSWAGQHRWAAVTWSGDVCATWETLRRHVPEGLHFTCTGEPWWSCDIGGFFTGRGEPWFWRGDFPGGAKDPGYRELFVRWMQYGCFLTMMRAHGTDTPREIWQFGEAGEPFYDAIADCIRLRYRLLAYQYALMAETCFAGVPPLRVPALVFPEDARLRETDDLMMLGNQLLIRPVTRPMYFLPGGERIPDPDESVAVYLPAGCRWYAFGGETAGEGRENVYEGGETVRVPAPLNRIPVFVRAGSILPLLPAQQYTDEKPSAPVDLVLYPGADGAFDFYDDDGITYGYEQGMYERIRMAWHDREQTLALSAREGGMRGERRFRIRLRGETREVAYTGEALTVRFAR